MDRLILYRLTLFLAFFTMFSVLQFSFPRRPFMNKRWKYMLSNLLISAFNNGILVLVSMIPLKAATIAYNHNIGLFHTLGLDSKLVAVTSIIILDVTIYFQHRIFHHVSFLWKLHSVHHIDPMLDTTTGFRFHPIEIVISNFIKVSIIFLFGTPVFAVLLFEIILNTTAMFNHSNFKVNGTLEKLLRSFLITPDLHLIHHSIDMNETNSNFGFSVPWWDWLFKTYTPNPKIDYEYMPLGIINMPEEKSILFPGLLVYPFKK